MTGIATAMVAKGICGNGGASETMSLWKTNFNMPSPNLTFPFTMLDECYDYDLTGFQPGFEVAIGKANYYWNCDATGCARVCMTWCRFDGACMYGLSRNICFCACCGYTYGFMVNTGIAPWEVCADGNYELSACAICLPGSGFDTAADCIFLNVCMRNVPSQTYIADVRGSIWVEGNNLAYINAGGCSNPTFTCGWKASITGACVGDSGSVSNAGAIWVNTDACSKITWVGNDGNIYVPNFAVQQYASFFVNGPTCSVNAGTCRAGEVWVDNEFGQTHLSYIGCDGYKWLTGAGNCPYIAPYG